MIEEEKIFELYRKYREYTNARMIECIEDAINICNEFSERRKFKSEEITQIAIILFDKRISPFYYWMQKEIARIKDADRKD